LTKLAYRDTVFIQMAKSSGSRSSLGRYTHRQRIKVGLMKSEMVLVIVLVMGLCVCGFGQNHEKGSLTGSAGLFMSSDEELLSASLVKKFGSDRYWNIALDLNTPFTLGGGTSYIGKSLSVGYGLSFAKRFVRISASIGPAVVWGYDWNYSEYQDHTYTSLGLNGRGQIYFTPIPEFGIGLEVVGSYDKFVNGYCQRPTIFFQRTL